MEKNIEVSKCTGLATEGGGEIGFLYQTGREATAGRKLEKKGGWARRGEQSRNKRKLWEKRSSNWERH